MHSAFDGREEIWFDNNIRFASLRFPGARPQSAGPVVRRITNLKLLMKRVSLLLLCLGLASHARANVYATNIRLNNGTTNVALPFSGSVRIGYILNEPATAGVAISVKSGSSLLRTITLTNSNAGTLRGTNAVVWDGEDSNGN